MLRRGEWARAWAAFLRVPPLRRSVYAASGGLTVGAALLAGTTLLAPGPADLARSREAAARIPRLARAQRAGDAAAAATRDDVATMVDATRGATSAEKLAVAGDALYAFHTNRPAIDSFRAGRRGD